MATVANRALCALGPIKMEVVYLTAVTAADTFTTLMQRPIFCLASETNTASANSTVQAVVTADSKTVTLYNPTTGGGNGKVCVAVFGF